MTSAHANRRAPRTYDTAARPADNAGARRRGREQRAQHRAVSALAQSQTDEGTQRLTVIAPSDFTVRRSTRHSRHGQQLRKQSTVRIAAGPFTAILGKWQQQRLCVPRCRHGQQPTIAQSHAVATHTTTRHASATPAHRHSERLRIIGCIARTAGSICLSNSLILCARCLTFDALE